MQVPAQITYRNMDQSAAVDDFIHKKIHKLEHISADLISCSVVVEAPHQHQHKGKLYTVAIDLRLPGTEIVVSHHPGHAPAHADVYVAIRDAFHAAQRRLESYHERRRGQVKQHEQRRA